MCKVTKYHTAECRWWMKNSWDFVLHCFPIPPSLSPPLLSTPLSAIIPVPAAWSARHYNYYILYVRLYIVQCKASKHVCWQTFIRTIEIWAIDYVDIIRDCQLFWPSPILDICRFLQKCERDCAEPDQSRDVRTNAAIRAAWESFPNKPWPDSESSYPLFFQDNIKATEIILRSDILLPLILKKGCKKMWNRPAPRKWKILWQFWPP